MKTYPIEKARHLVLRAGPGDMLPGDLTRALSEQVVTCGWLRASGVLLEVELRAFDGSLGAPGSTRRIAGPVQALSVEGSIGIEGSEPSVGLRAVLARETDRGLEVLAGEIVSARVVALEAVVTAFDDLSLGRAVDRTANVMLLGDSREPSSPSAPSAAPSLPNEARARADVIPPDRASAPAPAREPASTWTDAITASSEAARGPSAKVGALGGAIPQRIAKLTDHANDGALMPEAGDAVEHFAFGRAEVVKSDGDRLHLRAEKDGRIREIALEMLKVTPLESEGPNRRFRLERKL